MKIAIIFPRFTGPYGGERLLLNLAYNLSKLDNEITIYTHSYKEIDNSLTEKLRIVESFYPSVRSHQIATFLDLILMPLLVSKIKNTYEIILVIGWQSVFGSYLYKKFKNKDQKVIYYCLEPPRLVYDLSVATIKNTKFFKKIALISVMSLIKFIDKISVDSVDRIISISEWTRDQVKSIYNKDSLIIYPGVEVNRFNKFSKEQARKLLHIPFKQKVFLSVSKLHIRKRLDLAIEVFENKQDNNSVFFIIGDGPYRDNLARLIEGEKKDIIKLLGRLSDEKVTLYLRAADYFIFTAQNEPFGIAPLEAKVAGCKVIPNEPKYEILDWKAVAESHVKEYKSLFEKLH